MVNHQVLGKTEGLEKECKRQLRHDFLTMENAERGSKSVRRVGRAVARGGGAAAVGAPRGARVV